jgi:hypothetical protein
MGSNTWTHRDVHLSGLLENQERSERRSAGHLIRSSAGQAVGVTQASERVCLVTFIQYDLGYLEDETCRLEPIENPFGPKVLPIRSEWTPMTEPSARELAEREGFEPSVGFPLHTLSKRAPSTTRTSLR